jgi:hypothetical protein
MKDDSTVFVGLDVHKDTVAIAVAEDGRTEPRFVGTCGPELGELLKALAHLGDPSHPRFDYVGVHVTVPDYQTEAAPRLNR